MTFYVGHAGESVCSAWLRLPSSLVDSLLVALAYDPGALVSFRQLTSEDLLGRITSLRRQLTLGRGREFTSPLIDEPFLLRGLTELEKVAQQARSAGKRVLLVNA